MICGPPDPWHPRGSYRVCIDPGLYVKTRASGFENAEPWFRVRVFLTWPLASVNVVLTRLNGLTTKQKLKLVHRVAAITSGPSGPPFVVPGRTSTPSAPPLSMPLCSRLARKSVADSSR